jgi:hypothetical protein
METEHLLANLICVHATPIIEQVITTEIARFSTLDTSRRNHQTQDFEDIVAEAVLKVLVALRRLKKSPGDSTISDFRGYVAVMAFNTWHGYMRNRRASRASLKRRLHYLLTTHKDLAIWEGPRRKSICGFSRWTGTGPMARTGWVNQIRLHPEQFVSDVPDLNLAGLLHAIFTRANAPMDFEEVVSLIADILMITDEPHSVDTASRRSKCSEAAVEFTDPLKSEARRLLLKHLWNEIKQLPTAQRESLLFSFRGKGRVSGAVLLAEIDIASTHEICEALGISAEDFNLIRSQLPWEDNVISKRLGLSIQQVISCRLSAKRRLIRRLKSLRESEDM